MHLPPPQLIPMHDRQVVGTTLVHLTALELAHPPLSTGLALSCCPDEVLDPGSQVMQLTKGSVRSPAGGGRDKRGGHLSLIPTTTHSRQERWYQPRPSHTLRAGSSLPLSTRSTLLWYSGEAEGPFSRVLHLMRGWVRSPTDCRC